MSSPRPAANTSGGHAEQNMMTPSNIITIARICLVPVFVVALLSPWPEWLDIDDIVYQVGHRMCHLRAHIVHGLA